MRGEHSGRAVTGKRKERWTEREYERERERKGGMKENMNGKIRLVATVQRLKRNESY